MSNTLLEQIPRMTLKELYNLYVSTFYDQFEHNSVLKEEYTSIRFGENSEIQTIDIYDVIDEESSHQVSQTLAIQVHRDKQIVSYLGKTIPLHHYRTEKERRHALLQKRLIAYFMDDNPFESNLN